VKRLAILLIAIAFAGPAVAIRAQATLPSGPLALRDFTLRFDPAGTFALAGAGWPAMNGTWTAAGNEVTLQLASGPKGCTEPGRYTFAVNGASLTLSVVADACQPRRMILDRNVWMPPGTAPPPPTRTIARTAGPSAPPLRTASARPGNWPSFRGPQAAGSADGQQLPDQWNPATGDGVLWRTTIPGLAHSSPIVWNDLLFVTSAVSSSKDATFKPGLYGDGDASSDRTPQRWMLYAVDKRSGKVRWERTAAEGEPKNVRHIKSTYASASPATDGRIVVAWFGSQGVYAYDFAGNLRWKVDLGRVNMGAYDIPSYEWGPASSPIIWNGLVIIQCDTQADSFLLALNADTGETVWKTDRDELPSWGTPTVVTTAVGPELVTNASNFVRGYDPKTGRELWKMGGSSKITAPTPIFTEGLHIVASGRAPERPVFAVRPGARGDLTLAKGEDHSPHVAWSKIYLSNEDGDMLVVEAGPVFKLLATNTMGETLMATPALSEGVMYVRAASTLFAIGKK
jgi:hypothetical protein